MKLFISALFLTVIVAHCLSADISRKNRTETGRSHVFMPDCPDYGSIEHGKARRDDENVPTLLFECDPGYDLIGRPKIICQNGQWEKMPRPECAKPCAKPPFIRFGGVLIEGRRVEEEKDAFRKGTLAEYSCEDGFTLKPEHSRRRECKDGVWTGIQGSCESDGCRWPANITNGYFVLEGNSPPALGDSLSPVARVGQRAHYECNFGFVLVGEPTQQCVESGDWSPKQQPQCRRPMPSTTTPQEEQEVPVPALIPLNAGLRDESTDDENSEKIPLPPRPCPDPSPRPPNVVLASLTPPAGATSLGAEEGEDGLRARASGTRLELRCTVGTRDPSAPCQAFPLVCEDGKWIGRMPQCEPAEGCPAPPAAPHAAPLGLSADGRYATHAQVAYACLPGYSLVGPPLLMCAPSGCWEPAPPPSCRLDPRLFVSTRTLADYLSTSSILLVSAATALGVMLLLLGVCALVVCRRGRLAAPTARRPWLSLQAPAAGASAAPPPPPPPPPPAASAAAAAAAAAAAQRAAAAAAAARLLDPDRVALIAYTDGQLSESALPTYEEAVRERLGGAVGRGVGVGGLSFYRALHGRPHPWAALGPRCLPRPADPYAARQAVCGLGLGVNPGGGLGGENAGSTDTVAAMSEGSTSVTLDTASSHTCSSHSASCRAACGSLASFDAASGLTSEDVPLLEEQEPEDLLPPPPPPPASAAPVDLNGPGGGGPPYLKLRRASPDIV